MDERRIIIGLIASTEFIRRIHSDFDTRLLDSAAAQYIAQWALEYFDQYDKCPFTDIEPIFIEKCRKNEINDELAEEIREDILPDLSQDFEDNPLNVPYLLKQTKNYIREKRLEHYVEDVQDELTAGRIEKAETLALNYKPVAEDRDNEIDIRSEYFPEHLKSAFEARKEPILKYSGALGDLWNEDLVRGGFIGLLASDKAGKCLPGDQRVLTGLDEWKTIKELMNNDYKSIISYDQEKDKFVKSRVKQFWKNGGKKVYKVTTKTGRSVKVTYNHPFLTPDGWFDLNKLKVGDFIAVPKKLPFYNSDCKNLTNEQIKLLGYFLTEGSLHEYSYKSNTTNKVIGFTTTDCYIKKDFTNCIESMGCSVRWKNHIDCVVTNSETNVRKHDKNFVLNFIKKYDDIWNKQSYEKRVPADIFKLPKTKLSLFLKIIFSCDGWVERGKGRIGIALASENFTKDLFLLLSKFGIVSKLRYKPNNKRGAWQINISDYENIKKFRDEIGFLPEKQEKLNLSLINKPSKYKSLLDRFPTKIAEKFMSEIISDIWGDIAISREDKDVIFPSMNATNKEIKQGNNILRQSFYDVKDTKVGSKYFNSVILWDEILSIEYIGIEETFDLTVEPYHNFIAENMIVHNTFMLLDMAMRGMQQGRNVAFFQGGDMTQNEQLMRIGVYQSKRSNRLDSIGEMYEPVKDCIFNQLDQCDLPERESDLGIFESNKDNLEDYYAWYNKDNLVQAYEDNPDYAACHNCPMWKHNKWGVAWIEKINVERKLEYEEALKAIESFKNGNKGNFKMATYDNGTLSVSMIKSKLDSWEKEDSFYADIVLVDYADLLYTDKYSEFRHKQNDIWASLRGLSQNKHVLVIVPTQADANAYSSSLLKLSNFSEDKRKYSHVTAMFGLNRDTKGIEKRIGLMRINELLKREGDYDNFRQVKVIQNLKRGRPVIGSFW